MKTLLLCTDKNGGVSLFNKRQSSDRYLIDKIFTLFPNDKIYIEEYSKSLFENYLDRYTLEDGSEYNDGIHFVERKAVDLEQFDTLYIFCWNREYPSTEQINVDNDKFVMYNKEKFPGYSHETITLRIYNKRK